MSSRVISVNWMRIRIGIAIHLGKCGILEEEINHLPQEYQEVFLLGCVRMKDGSMFLTEEGAKAMNDILLMEDIL